MEWLGSEKVPWSGCYSQAFRLASPCGVVQPGCHWRVQELSLKHTNIFSVCLLRVKSCGNVLFVHGMDRQHRHEAHDAFWNKRLRQDEARVKLAWMKRYEFLALKWEQLGHETAPQRREIERLRDRYTELYWNAVGVRPEQRLDLRRVLEHVAEHGDRIVADIIEELRDSYGNRVSGGFACFDGAGV